jgi:uncharacterized protein (TIGR02996 family)
VTDDEAFIRRIVDSPGDDLPRLVYADWLDERGDPRAAYLRAEVKWAAEKSAIGGTRLQEAAKELDALWAARVTRPPIGVCCDQTRFREVGPTLSLAAVREAERQLRIHFPIQFVAFLLNQNGGVPSACRIAGLNGELEPAELTRFLSVLPNHLKASSLRRIRLASWQTPHHVVRQYLTIGEVTHDRPDCVLMLGLSGSDSGRVFFHFGPPEPRFDPSDLDELNTDFASLLARLTESDDPFWVEHFLNSEL